MEKLAHHPSVEWELNAEENFVVDTWKGFNGFRTRFPTLGRAFEACFGLLPLTSVRCEQFFSKEKASIQKERTATETDLRAHLQQEAFMHRHEYTLCEKKRRLQKAKEGELDFSEVGNFKTAGSKGYVMHMAACVGRSADELSPLTRDDLPSVRQASHKKKKQRLETFCQTETMKKLTDTELLNSRTRERTSLIEWAKRAERQCQKSETLHLSLEMKANVGRYEKIAKQQVKPFPPIPFPTNTYNQTM